MAEEKPPAEMSQAEPLSVLWRVFSAPQTLLLLMGLLALTVALGTWIPQIPPQASGDPQAWLATQPGFLGDENSLASAMGLHDLYHSFWFRLLLVLTGLVLFVRAVDATELAWRATSKGGQHNAMFPAWQPHLPVQQIAAPLPVEEAASRAGEYLVRSGYRYSQLPSTASKPPGAVVAGRRVLALWVRPAGYAALLLALLGLFVAGSLGWQTDPIQLLPGEGRSAGHGTLYGFRLDGFRLRLDNSGRLAGYESEITWLEGQAEVGQDMAGIGQPARHGGLALHQAGFVPAVRLSAQDAAGQPVPLESGSTDASRGNELLVRFSSPEDQPAVFLPHLDRFLVLTFEPQCDAGRPAVHVDLLDDAGATRQRLGSVGGSGILPTDGGQLNAELLYVPILRLESRPALGLALAAALLALLLLALSWAVPVRLAWLTFVPAAGGRSAVWLSGLAGAGQREWLTGLAGGVEEVLQDAG